MNSLSIYDEKGVEILADTAKFPEYGSFFMPEGNVTIVAESVPYFETYSVDSRALKPGVTVKEYNSGGNSISSVIPNANRTNVNNWLGKHENDNYYLGTPYPERSDGSFIAGRNGGTDRRNPNGDCGGQNGYDDYAGVAMMNCTGFVWHVLYKASGLGYQDAYNRIPAWGGVGQGNWRDWLRNNRVEYRTYQTSNINDINNLIESALYHDKYIEKGDIIWTWDGSVGADGLPAGTSGSHHVGIYTGTDSNFNEWWHSLGYSSYVGKYFNTNFKSNVLPKNPCVAITVIKLDKDIKGSANLKKESANSSITNGNNYYSLAGAVYRVYSDAGCTNKVGDLTTDASGNTNTISLNAGTYYVKEITPSKGYELDTQIYTVNVQSGKTATVTSKEPPKSGKIKLEKTSAKPDVTDGNNNYSLAGAEYSVYRNSACTDFVDKIVTDDKGKGSLDNLPLGTYYVKETKASQGYGLDTKVYTVDITSGDTAVIEKTVTSKEIPILDPVTIILRKVDSETGQGTPKGSSLENAQFRVKYYPVIMDTDPAKSGHTPTKTWVLKTDKNGLVQLNDAHKVSGDDFFYSPTGSVALPYGTLTFEEIKAPEGYLLNPTIIVSKIASTVNNNIVYNAPIQKENVLKMDIEKIQAGTSKPIKGVVFEHTKPDGSKETLTTDENGQLSFKGLQWGEHTVKEISAPDGYSLNTNKITFTVGTDNKITITSKGTETDTDGNIKITVTKDGNISAVVEDKPAPYDLLIHKVNEKDKVLEGAEFTLYSDAECKQEIAKAVSKSDGTLRFDDLIVGKTYYLKETKAPEGYRIPVNPDGSDIVYTIKAESVPVDNLFKVIINGKEYDSSSTGAFKVTGTKADRVVDMTITNHTTKKLPETGSYWMIPILIIGAGLMIYGMRKTKNPHGDDEDKTMDTKKEE